MSTTHVHKLRITSTEVCPGISGGPYASIAMAETDYAGRMNGSDITMFFEDPNALRELGKAVNAMADKLEAMQCAPTE